MFTKLHFSEFKNSGRRRQEGHLIIADEGPSEAARATCERIHVCACVEDRPLLVMSFGLKYQGPNPSKCGTQRWFGWFGWFSMACICGGSLNVWTCLDLDSPKTLLLYILQLDVVADLACN